MSRRGTVLVGAAHDSSWARMHAATAVLDLWHQIREYSEDSSPSTRFKHKDFEYRCEGLDWFTLAERGPEPQENLFHSARPGTRQRTGSITVLS